MHRRLVLHPPHPTCIPLTPPASPRQVRGTHAWDSFSSSIASARQEAGRMPVAFLLLYADNAEIAAEGSSDTLTLNLTLALTLPLTLALALGA